MNKPCKHGHFDGAMHAPCYQCRAEHWEEIAEGRAADKYALHTRIEQFQFCINTVAAELGVCCGGVDSSPQEQLSDPHSTTRVLVDAIAKRSAPEPTQAPPKTPGVRKVDSAPDAGQQKECLDDWRIVTVEAPIRYADLLLDLCSVADDCEAVFHQCLHLSVEARTKKMERAKRLRKHIKFIQSWK